MPNELPSSALNSAHPERYILGKPHPDRARQFKPFAALRGYEELIEQVWQKQTSPTISRSSKNLAKGDKLPGSLSSIVLARTHEVEA